MKKFFISILALACSVAAMAQVTVVYNGDTATVTVDSSVMQYLTVTQQGAHVSISQSDSVASEITYNLSGSSSDGGFYMSGSYKATVELNGLTLANTSAVYSGAYPERQTHQREGRHGYREHPC